MKSLWTRTPLGEVAKTSSSICWRRMLWVGRRIVYSLIISTIASRVWELPGQASKWCISFGIAGKYPILNGASGTGAKSRSSISSWKETFPTWEGPSCWMRWSYGDEHKPTKYQPLFQEAPNLATQDTKLVDESSKCHLYTDPQLREVEVEGIHILIQSVCTSEWDEHLVAEGICGSATA